MATTLVLGMALGVSRLSPAAPAPAPAPAASARSKANAKVDAGVDPEKVREQWLKAAREQLDAREEAEHADGGREPEDVSDEALLALSIYRNHVPKPLGDQSIYNGVPMKMYELEVREPMDAVIKNYGEQFQKKHLALLNGEAPNIRGGRYLSYHPRRSQRSLTLVLTPAGVSTQVLVSLSDPSAFFTSKATYPAGLPQPANVENLIVNEVRDGTSWQHAITFQVEDHTADELMRFFSDGLVQRGFVLSPDQTDPASVGTTFMRNQETLTLKVAPLSESKTPNKNAGAEVNLMWVQP
jgi:hypothetical protein